MRARNQYLKTLVRRYLKADRGEKGALLDEYCRNTGQNRKYVIRKIGARAFKESLPRKVRTRSYGGDVKGALVWLWEVFSISFAI